MDGSQAGLLRYDPYGTRSPPNERFICMCATANVGVVLCCPTHLPHLRFFVGAPPAPGTRPHMAVLLPFGPLKVAYGLHWQP